MNCGEFEARIQRVLDRRQSLTSDDALVDHALACSECAARLDAYVELLEQIEDWQPPLLDEDFSRRTVQRAFPSTVGVQPRTRAKERRFGYQVLAVVACLLVIAALPRFWSPPVSNHSSSDDSATVSTPPAVMLASTAGQNQPTLPTMEIDNFEQAAETARQAENRDGDDWRRLWAEWSGRLPAESFEPLDRLTQGIKPITASLTTALDSLRTTFPLGEFPSAPSATRDAAILESRAADLMG
ncbi:MAG: hypothetical protein KJ000_35250 [Pirellulaceae bacterium]|nr:hypothetical protein [Pirellulaceae bacterium]